ncbi:hypothetical protein BDN72DRAFT_739650, partial [Pluteus cervinus]
CTGVVVNLPAGVSPNTAYPFGLHNLPAYGWDYSVMNGVLTLRSRLCKPRHGTNQCAACRELSKNDVVINLLQRVEDGVHENAPLIYHGIGSLMDITRQKNTYINKLQLKGLNDARKIVSRGVLLETHKQWIMAIGSGRVERVDRLVRAGLAARRGVRGLLGIYERAAQKLYRTRNYTEEDALRGLLFWRLGGARVAEIGHRALDLPSLSTLRRRTLIPQILPSTYFPTVAEIERNVDACFSGISGVVAEHNVVHQVLMVDELKVEERPRWNPGTNTIFGVCREHGHQTSLVFNGKDDVDMLAECIYGDEDTPPSVHLAVEATVGALGPLSSEPRIYTAWPVLVSGSCKRESGVQHAQLLRTAVEASPKSKLRVVCIASDGESRRGEALIVETFKRKLSTTSPIHSLLSVIPLMNVEVGDDDITADKDYKHVFKRCRNLMLRVRGLRVHGVDLLPATLKSHLQDNNLTSIRVGNLTKPDDKQDVKLAYDLLQSIWSLSLSSSPRPGFSSARKALMTLGTLFRHLIIPYICVDLDLSEQMTHLSAAAHLLLALRREADTGTKLMPTQLYVDIMIMIKNAFFCVAKSKVDDPDGKFWLILLGTDRLEELFGILRTMVGNDTNVDVLQLGLRLTGTTEVSTILAKYPHWDRAPHRLKLPMLSKDLVEISDGVDHIKPASWRGNVEVRHVNLQTCWIRGRQMVEKEVPCLRPVLESIPQDHSVDILRPYGTDLIRAPREAEDYDDTAE